MKKSMLILGTVCMFFAAHAQEDIPSLQKNAKAFLLSGDYANALTILNKARKIDNTNLSVVKDIAQVYYLKKDYSDAIKEVSSLLNTGAEDATCYQILGSSEKAIDKLKDAEKTYKAGLKKYPAFGPLYNELGEVLLANGKEKDALNYWLKGIEAAPSYSANYGNAATALFKDPTDKIWAIIYGEIYANMERLNPKTDNIKKMVFDAYQQKIFAVVSLETDIKKSKNEFEKAVLTTFEKSKSIANMGVTPETLSMMRTRFVLDWYAHYAEKFPFRLFEYHKQMLQEGMFDSYNQWLFGIVTNFKNFEKWYNANTDAYNKFADYHKNRVFKIPAAQHYYFK